MNLGAALDRAEIPILLITGWQDIFLDQTLEQYRRLHERGVDVAATIGPWSHIAVGAGAAQITSSETFDWMEEHLSGRGRRKRPSPVHIYVTGADEWRDLDTWPPATTPSTLYLRSHRDLSAEPPGDDAPASSFLFDPARPTPRSAGHCSGSAASRTTPSWASGPTSPAGPRRSSNRTSRSSVRRSSNWPTTATTPTSTSSSGSPRSGPTGARTTSPRASGASIPDRGPGPVTLPLRDMAHRFVAGTRLRLLVAGGSHPQFARNLGTGENPGTGTELVAVRHTIHHGQGGCSRLVLPVSGL